MTKTTRQFDRTSPDQFTLFYPAHRPGGTTLYCVCTWHKAIPEIPMLNEAGWDVVSFKTPRGRNQVRKEYEVDLPDEVAVLVFCDDIYNRMRK